MHLPASNLRRVILSVQPHPFTGLGDCLRLGRSQLRPSRAKIRLLVAMLTEMDRQCARIDAVDAGYAVLLQVVVKALLAPPVAGRGQVADYESGQKKGAAFHVRAIDSVISDLRGGEGDELPGVGRVGEDFLIAAHAGVEHDLAERIFRGAKRDAVEHRSVRQREKRLSLALRFPFSFVIHQYDLSEFFSR